jgi:hypothetical protein
MSVAFGDIRTLPATDEAKDIMKQFVLKEIFNEQREVWMLGATLGIIYNKVYTEGTRNTFQNINSLDPERIFAAIMMGKYPDLSPEERVKKLVDHAEWGIRLLATKEQANELDFSKIGLEQIT